jgi:hypothetical protein
VQRFLTIEVAGRNPAAYIAHFRRLSPEDQAGYLRGLGPEALALHARTLGEKATLGFTLVLGGPSLTATVAGQVLPTATGWADLAALEAHARDLAARLGEPVVTCLVEAELWELEAMTARLREAGVEISEVQAVGDAGGDGASPSLEWSLRGRLSRGGQLWSQRRFLPWSEREAALARLQRVAEACGATFSSQQL